jgi:hypothetical protein
VSRGLGDVYKRQGIQRNSILNPPPPKKKKRKRKGRTGQDSSVQLGSE